MASDLLKAYTAARQSGLGVNDAYAAAKQGNVAAASAAQNTQTAAQNSGTLAQNYILARRRGMSEDDAYTYAKNPTAYTGTASGTQPRLYDDKNNQQTLLEKARSATADSAIGNALANRRLERLTKKYGNQVFDDNFLGQFRANYGAGKISQEYAMAYSDYMDNPTRENYDYAVAMRDLYNQMVANNQEALDDQNVRAEWLTKDIAGYLPQLGNQLKTSLPYAAAGIISGAKSGAAAGAAAGGVIGEVVTPIPVLDGLLGGGAGAVIGGIAGAIGSPLTKAGLTVGSGVYSYDTMRGMAFANLVDMGVDEAKAKAAANDEALISAAIEMGDTAFDLFTKIPGISGTLKNLSEKTSKTAIQRLVKELASYGFNVGQEYGEEYIQEIISMANERRVARGEYDSGITGLVNECIALAKDMHAGNAEAEKAQAQEAGKGGAVIGAVMGAGRTGVGKIVNRMNEVTIRENLNKVIDNPDLVNETDENLTRLRDLADNKATRNEAASEAIQKEQARREEVRQKQEEAAKHTADQNNRLNNFTSETLRGLTDEELNRERTIAESLQNHAAVDKIDEVIYRREEEARTQARQQQEQEQQQQQQEQQAPAQEQPSQAESMAEAILQQIRQRQQEQTETQPAAEATMPQFQLQQQQESQAQQQSQPTQAEQILQQIRGEQAQEQAQEQEQHPDDFPRETPPIWEQEQPTEMTPAQRTAWEKSRQLADEINQTFDDIYNSFGNSFGREETENRSASIPFEIPGEKSSAHEAQTTAESHSVGKGSPEYNLVKQLIHRAGINDDYINYLVISRDGNTLIVGNDLERYGESLAEAIYEDPTIKCKLTVNLVTGEVVDEGLLSEYGERFVIPIDESLKEETNGRGEEPRSSNSARINGLQSGTPMGSVKYAGRRTDSAASGSRRPTLTPNSSNRHELPSARVSGVVEGIPPADQMPRHRQIPRQRILLPEYGATVEVVEDLNTGEVYSRMHPNDLMNWDVAPAEYQDEYFEFRNASRPLAGKEYNEFATLYPDAIGAIDLLNEFLDGMLLIKGDGKWAFRTDDVVVSDKGQAQYRIGGQCLHANGADGVRRIGLVAAPMYFTHEFSHGVKDVLGQVEGSAYLHAIRNMTDPLTWALFTDMVDERYWDEDPMSRLDETVSFILQSHRFARYGQIGDGSLLSQEVEKAHPGLAPGSYYGISINTYDVATKIVNSPEFAGYIDKFIQARGVKGLSAADVVGAIQALNDFSHSFYPDSSEQFKDYGDLSALSQQNADKVRNAVDARHNGYIPTQTQQNQQGRSQSNFVTSEQNDGIEAQDDYLDEEGRFEFTDEDIPPEVDNEPYENQPTYARPQTAEATDINSEEAQAAIKEKEARGGVTSDPGERGNGFFDQHENFLRSHPDVSAEDASVSVEDVLKCVPENKNGKGKVGRYTIYSGVSRNANVELPDGSRLRIPEYTVEVFDGKRVVSYTTTVSSHLAAANKATLDIAAYEKGLTKAAIPETGMTTKQFQNALQEVYGNLWYNGTIVEANRRKQVVRFDHAKAVIADGRYEVDLNTRQTKDNRGRPVPVYDFEITYIADDGTRIPADKGSVNARDVLSPVWLMSKLIHTFDIQMGRLAESQEARQKNWEIKKAERQQRKAEEGPGVDYDEELSRINTEEQEPLKRTPERVFSDREAPPETKPWEAYHNADEYAKARETEQGEEETDAQRRQRQKKQLHEMYGAQYQDVVYGAKRMEKQKFYFEDKNSVDTTSPGYANAVKGAAKFREQVNALSEGRITMEQFADYYLSMADDDAMAEFYSERVAERMRAVKAAADKVAESPNPGYVLSYRHASSDAVKSLETNLSQTNTARRQMLEIASQLVKHAPKSKSGKMGKAAKEAAAFYTRWQISPGNVFRMIDGFDKTENGIGYQLQKEIDKATAKHQKTIAKAQMQFLKLRDMNGYAEFANGTSRSSVKVAGADLSQQEAAHLIRLIDTLKATGKDRLDSIYGFARQNMDGEYEFLELKDIVGNDNPSLELGKLRDRLYASLDDVAKAYLDISAEVLDELGTENTAVETAVNGVTPRQYKKGQYIPVHYGSKQDYRSAATTDPVAFSAMEERSRTAGGYVRLQPISLAVDNYIAQSANHIAYAEIGRKLELMNSKSGVTPSLSELMGEHFSDQYAKWMDNYVEDLTDFHQADKSDGINSLLGKGRRALQTGALWGSVSVPMKQISSYWSAMGVLSPEAVVKAYRSKFVKSKGSAGLNLLLEYRKLGNIDPTVSDVLKADFLAKLMNKSKVMSAIGNAISTMDVRTVDNLYAATVLDTKLKNPDMDVNSQEFFNAVEEKFEEVVINTQPIYTKNARAEYARTDNELIKIMSMFRTQQTQNFNRLITTIGEYKASKDKATGILNQVTLENTIKGQAIASLSLALLSIAADWILHKQKKYEDDEGDLDLEKLFDRFAMNAVESASGTAWFGDQAAKWLIDQMSEGETNEFYGLSLGPINTIQTLMERIGYFVDSPTLSNARYVAGYMAQLFGIPLNNAYQFLNSAVMYTADAAGQNKRNYDDVLKMLDKEAIAAGWKSDNANANILLNAYLSGKSAKENRVFELLGGEDSKSALKSAAKSAYVDGTMDREQARSFLEKYLFPEEKEEAAELLEEWQMQRDTGIAYDQMGEAYQDGRLSRGDVIEYRMTYGGESREDAEKYIAKQEFKKQYDVSYNDMKELYRSGGISREDAIRWRIMCGSSEESARSWADAQDVYLETGYEYTSSGSTSYMDSYSTKERLGTNSFYAKYGDQFKAPSDFGKVFNALNNASDNDYAPLYYMYKGEESELGNKQRGVVYLLNGFINDGTITRELADRIWAEYFGYSTWSGGAYQFLGNSKIA